jgi:hypothetical protein
MAGVAAVVVVVIAYLKWHAQINQGVKVALGAIYRFLKDPKTCKVAETFCNEVAVLWFVFPLLDSIYEHWKENGDKHLQVGIPSLHQAFLVSGMFFVFAVVLSHIAGGKGEE